VTVVRAADDRYYASFVVDVAQMPLPQSGNDVGIDLGLTSLLDVEDQAGCSVAVLTAVIGLVSRLVAGCLRGSPGWSRST
jgi:transposase